MIYKVNDSEHFNLTLHIIPFEDKYGSADHIGVDVILLNKENKCRMCEQFNSSEFREALQLYKRYEEMFFGKRGLCV